MTGETPRRSGTKTGKHTPRRTVGAASDGLPRCEQSDLVPFEPREGATERHEPCTATSTRRLVGVSESKEPGGRVTGAIRPVRDGR